METKTFVWSQIPNEIPDVSGVYAWYLKSEISQGEIKRCIQEMGVIEDRNAKIEIIRETIKANLIRPVSPSPYRVELEGDLMPSYQGDINFIEHLDADMLGRFVDDPNELEVLGELISLTSPAFASPLYIGMSSNLRKRINQHKKLIQKNDEQNTSSFTKNSEGPQSFANEISRRSIDFTRLFVQILEMDREVQYVRDLEYMLNRISYPIFGKK